MPDDQLDLEPAIPADEQQVAPARITTEYVRGLLRKAYADGWALLEEVAPRNGGGTRYADALAVGLWQSRGHQIIGFEIKVSRSDWVSELKNPAKVEEGVFRYCDHWIVVAPPGIVRDGELPPTWGLMEVGATLRRKVAAPRLDAKPITREFFASLMRRGQESIDDRARRMSEDHRKSLEAQFVNRVETAVRNRAGENRDLLDKVERIRKECGFDPIGDRWAGPPIRTLKLAMYLAELDDWKDNPLGKLTDMLDSLDQARHYIATAIDESGLREGGSKIGPKE